MWIGRRRSANRNWYSSLSTWRRVFLALLVPMMMPFCCCSGLIGRKYYIHWFVFTSEDREFFKDTRYRDGVPSAARKLIAEMEPYDDLDAAVEAHPDWFEHRFPTGEWIFGHGINSHGLSMAGQGTLVIKDSRGRTRVFFGHVCGTNASFPYILKVTKTLDDMEKEKLFTMHDFREWKQ